MIEPVSRADWLIDTNIVSELMRDRPNTAVLAWLDASRQNRLFLSSVSIMELRYGLARLAEGRRRQQLEAALGAVITEDFVGRILGFDLAAAEQAGVLQAQREASGRPVEVRDTMIAGIALANRMGIATRNMADFHGMDVPVVNPFDAQP